ncbi:MULTISPECIES: hypothetical protein [Tenacibaculum]|uniref:Uncharacterized protein n=2 Tax=Tenacibaculum TaxID=104267 RepID=A0AAP1RE34_9FLAO|nr:hypothetical protein [Tenacibaculum finnmarkense]MCD8406825.1 hypothetical protein [Tenacibaculum dicentrarchi]MBE7652112.1 hypothetical protein [Tenacibaculum finnmarkense genomovar finnmarkense]MBE7694173.1 hypothetical protein [Tenacibaculum finnmarkense genomovar finnmarkense]MCD8426329.1 hypothetical protein [Tenacibaculum finnmarkense genomovar finnmarkense]MCD8434130.1 hypothetical protein [Tenacibaculum dicentrarchi]
MYKKLLIILVLIISSDANAQCAMCKAVVEGGNETIAEGVNNGITYLMIFPYILVGVLFYFIYKHKKSSKKY